MNEIPDDIFHIQNNSKTNLENDGNENEIDMNAIIESFTNDLLIFHQIIEEQRFNDVKNIISKLKQYFLPDPNNDRSDLISIDANSEIGYFSKIGNNVSIINKSKVGTNCEILTNSTISNSKIDDDVIIGAGAIIENSVIKQGAQIGFGSVIKNSVIGENVSVGSSSKILKSKIEDEAVVEDFVTTVRVQVGKNAKVCSGARVVAGENAILIEENSTINANAKF